MSSFHTVANVIEDLPNLVRVVRKTLGLSLRAITDETGISINTLSRFDRGAPISQEHIVELLRWLHRRQPDALRVMFDRRERLDGWAVSANEVQP